MPLDFPSSPSLNDTYSFGGKTWVWNGSAWALQNTGSINNIPIGNITPNTGAFTTLSASGNLTAANANLGNAVTANYFIGNGALLTGLPASYSNADVANYLPTYTGNLSAGNANITGNLVAGNISTGAGSGGNITGANLVSASFLAGTLTTAAQPNITSVGTLSTLTVTGNILGGNANLGNAVTANYFVGNGALLTGLPAGYSNADVANYLPTYTGNLTAGNANLGNAVSANYFIGNFYGTANSATTATTAGTVTTAAQPNITSVGTLSSLAVTGNITAGNANLGNALSANYLTINNNANVTGNLTAGNFAVGAGSGGEITGANLVSANFLTGTLTTAAQPNITSVGSLSSLTVTGNATAGNVYANSGTIGASLLTGTLTTAAQPNITSIGTLSSLSVSGNAVIGGNLTVNGNLSYINVETLAVEDPIINLQTGPNGAAPTSNSGKDVGTALNYYDSQARIAFMGWDVSNAEFGLASQASISSEVVTFDAYGNLRVGNIIGNGQALTGITGANVTGQVANATVAGTVYTAAQPNITSVGTLTSLTVSGNVSAGNANVTGNLTAGNITTSGGSGGSISGANSITANYFVGNGALLTGLPAGYSNADVANYLPTYTGNLTAGNANLGNALSANYLTINNSANVTGNLSAGNVSIGTGSGGALTGANSITANYFIGNGALLTGLPAGYSNADVANYLPTYTGNLTAGNANLGNAVSANYFIGNFYGTANTATTAGTVTTAAQPNITSVGTLSSLAVTGNITAGNANLGNALSANYLTVNNNANVTGNLTAGNITTSGGSGGSISGANSITANYFIGNGALLTDLPAGYSNADVANYLPTYTGNLSAGNANITSNLTVANANVTGNLSAGTVSVGAGSGGNITGANLVSANFFTGTLTTAAQPNITSVGTLTSLAVTGNATAGNVYANSGTIGASLLTGTLTTAAQPNITSVGTLSSLAVTGNITAGNANLGNLATANFINISNNANITGNLTAGNFAVGAGSGGEITGANLVSANFFTGTLTTAAQPNITSIGTLSSLAVSGNAVIGGNLTVNGNLSYINVETLAVEDPIINLQTGPNGAAPTSNSGKDVGTALNYYDSQARIAFMGWDVSNAEFGLASQATISSEVVTFDAYGNLRVGNIIGNGQALTGIAGGNVTGQVANALVAGTVYTAAQPNITSVGTLTSLTVSGNLTSGNANLGNALSANYLTVNNNANVTGNLTAGNFAVGAGSGGEITGANSITANYFVGNGALLTGISGGGSTTVSTTAPSSPSQGDIWIDTTNGVQLIYFNDGNSSQWVQMI